MSNLLAKFVDTTQGIVLVQRDPRYAPSPATEFEIELRAEVERLRAQLKPMPCGHIAWCEHDGECTVCLTQTIQDEYESDANHADARLAKVVAVLEQNRASAEKAIDEPDHPAWFYSAAQATVSVCKTALSAAAEGKS